MAVSVNIVAGLTYLDLVEDELSISKPNEEMILSNFIRDPPIPNSSWPTVMIAQSHGRKGPGGGAGSKANIRVDMNGDPLDFRSAMEQSYTDWNPAVKAKIRSQIENGTFDITFLPPGKTAIGCRWVFKRKEESVPEDLADESYSIATNPNNQKPVLCRKSGKRRIQTQYKARLVAKGYEQQPGID